METYNLDLRIRSDIDKTSIKEDIAYVNQLTTELFNIYIYRLGARKRIVEILTSAHLKGADIGEYKRRLGEVDAETQTIENDLAEFLAFENRLKQTQPNKSENQENE